VRKSLLAFEERLRDFGPFYFGYTDMYSTYIRNNKNHNKYKTVSPNLNSV
jgi:hypothetical protein